MNKHEIISQSFAMFRQYGVKSVTMDDIASRLSISKKTLYAHFSNKEGLIKTGIEKVFKRLFSEHNQIKTLELSPLLSLTLFYYSILKEIARYEHTYFYTVNRYSLGITERIERNRDKLIDYYITPLLEEAKAKGQLSRGVNLSIFKRQHLSRIEDSYHELLLISPQPTLIESLWHLIIFPINGICNLNYQKTYLIDVKKQLALKI